MTTLTTTPFILNAINYGPILLPRSHPNSHPADQNQHARLGLGGTPALFIYQNDHLYLLPHDMYGGAGGRMKLLGRHRDEERSLLPKRVFFLGEEGDAAGGIAFEAASERGRFYVKCAGAPLGVLDGYLYAHMVAPGHVVEFEVLPQSIV